MSSNSILNKLIEVSNNDGVIPYIKLLRIESLVMSNNSTIKWIYIAATIHLNLIIVSTSSIILINLNSRSLCVIPIKKSKLLCELN